MHTRNLDALRRVVQEAIDHGRLGSARFLRCISGPIDRGELEAALADLVELGGGWFGAPPAQRHRMGSGRDGYLTEMLKWRDGQGAVLTVTSGSTASGPGLDLMLIGSRGTLYHEE